MENKIFKKSLIISLLISSFLLTSCFNEENSKKENKINKYYDVEYVETGSITSNESYISYAKGIKEIPLSSKVPGRIIYLSKKIGDKVKNNELIAEVSTQEAKNGEKTALSIISSLEKLKTSTALSFDEQIKSVETKINQIKIGAQLSEIGVEGAKSGFQSAKTINKRQVDTLGGQIKQAQTGVKQAESQVEIAKAKAKQALSGIQLAKSELDSVKTAFVELNKTLETKEKIIYDNSFDAITNSIILYTNIIDFADQLMGYSKNTKENAKKIKDYLSAKNTKYLSLTEKNYIKVNSLLREYKKIYSEKIETKKATKEEIKGILKKGENISLELKILLKNIYNVVDNSIDNVYLPLSQINFYKSQISNMGVKLDMPGMLSLKGNLQTILNFETEKSRQIETLKSKLKTAQKGLQIAESNALIAKSGIISAQNAVLTAKSGVFTSQKNLEQYKEMGKGKLIGINTNELLAKKQKELTLDKKNEVYKMINSLKAKKIAQLKEIDAKIAEAKGNLESAKIMVDNAKVFSPVSGIITKKMVEVGQVIGAGFPIYMINDNSKIKLEVEVNDEIVKNLKLKDKVVVEFEGINKKFTGKISSIPNTKNRITKKTTVEIIIENKKSSIKVGSLAKVYFTKINKNGVTIPNSAIIGKFMIPGVYIVKNKKVIFKEIKIISSNGEKSQVSGINAGETIISKGTENLNDGEILK